MRPARVLVVDDSTSMRGLIVNALSHDPGISVVGAVSNPFEAREAIKVLNPDVMTLDVEMPGMDGLSFLEKVMRLRPLPVIMVSNVTARGAAATIAALELGAVDCICKPTVENPRAFDRLAELVRAAAVARVDRRASSPAGSIVADFLPDGKLVAIGASTGGVEALMAVISKFPANCPPTVLAIHMPESFTGSFSKRLDSLTPARVVEADDGAIIEPGVVHVARGGRHLAIAASGRERCRLLRTDPVSGHRPSLDVLFESVATARGSNAVGVILTGMGRDGAAGLLAMRRQGARTIGQDEATSVVYGMPRAAYEAGAICKQLPLGRIANEILAATSRTRKGN